ncbi:hypothetical protein [Tahibacter amnicola]|uniref:Uncharacterized protein n=1 Tax=Tahibacter amnicola TaxID=2976241 RepID=A0ABY6BK40_9GAMM|nr:hypothetical protein [Tahibacter amnicola]UXI70127.1 hypothetical protein N4264_11000 [Tahibacter amnicola]
MKPASTAAALAALLFTTASTAVTVPLVISDEDHTNAVAWTYSDGVASFTTDTPVICAKVDENISSGAQSVDFQQPGLGTRIGNFLFGRTDAQGRQMPLSGLRVLEYVPTLRLLTDEELVCYVLRSDGTRKRTANLFLAPFDETPDATAAITVAALPDASNGFLYTYYLDVTIPAMSASEPVPYVVSNGYDSSVFSNPRFCKVAPGVTSCGAAPVVSTNVHDRVSVAPGETVRARYIVTLSAGQVIDGSIPPTSTLALAGLFTYMGGEVRLDNNVAVGRNALGNSALQNLAGGRP